ncbi:MAG: hypothetical protein EHM28_06700 [Spirochaetaceae bacterium]|nr:MAG: hypothetical protein EHM28_06700 [Spirochaetaceae bacterium]
MGYDIIYIGSLSFPHEAHKAWLASIVTPLSDCPEEWQFTGEPGSVSNLLTELQDGSQANIVWSKGRLELSAMVSGDSGFHLNRRGALIAVFACASMHKAAGRLTAHEYDTGLGVELVVSSEGIRLSELEPAQCAQIEESPAFASLMSRLETSLDGQFKDFPQAQMAEFGPDDNKIMDQTMNALRNSDPTALMQAAAAIPDDFILNGSKCGRLTDGAVDAAELMQAISGDSKRFDIVSRRALSILPVRLWAAIDPAAALEPARKLVTDALAIELRQSAAAAIIVAGGSNEVKFVLENLERLVPKTMDINNKYQLQNAPCCLALAALDAAGLALVRDKLQSLASEPFRKLDDATTMAVEILCTAMAESKNDSDRVIVCKIRLFHPSWYLKDATWASYSGGPVVDKLLLQELGRHKDPAVQKAAVTALCKGHPDEAANRMLSLLDMPHSESILIACLHYATELQKGPFPLPSPAEKCLRLIADRVPLGRSLSPLTTLFAINPEDAIDLFTRRITELPPLLACDFAHYHRDIRLVPALRALLPRAKGEETKHVQTMIDKLEGKYTQPPRAMIEVSPSGRASCRACKEKIKNGELRFGEVWSPADEVPVKYRYYHLACAVKKKPKLIGPLLENSELDIPDREALLSMLKEKRKKE